MSIMDMGGSPPQTIDLPAPGAGAGPPAVRDLISQVRQLADSDPDHVDKLLLEKVTTLLQEYAARQQKLSDQAMGAGPGLKAVRKASAAPSAGGY